MFNMPLATECLQDFVSRNANVLIAAFSEKVLTRSVEQGYEENDCFAYLHLFNKKLANLGICSVDLWCDVCGRGNLPRFALSIEVGKNDSLDVKDFDLCTFSSCDYWCKLNPSNAEHYLYDVEESFYNRPILEITSNKVCKEVYVHDSVFTPSKKQHAALDSICKNEDSILFISYYFREDELEFAIEDFKNSLLSLFVVNGCSRLQLVLARIGQGVYRRDQLDKWGCCAVTGCVNSALLIASHIKPWARASDIEKLDVHNGFLLHSTLDKAFDKYLISFGDDGRIIISKSLSDEDLKAMNVTRNSKILDKDKLKPCLKYLCDHRARFYKLEEKRVGHA